MMGWYLWSHLRTDVTTKSEKNTRFLTTHIQLGLQCHIFSHLRNLCIQKVTAVLFWSYESVLTKIWYDGLVPKKSSQNRCYHHIIENYYISHYIYPVGATMSDFLTSQSSMYTKSYCSPFLILWIITNQTLISWVGTCKVISEQMLQSNQ